MAMCEDCEQDMETAGSCDVSRMAIGDRVVVRQRWRRARGEDPTRCGDCGVEPGGWHHVGCDLEPCSLCRGQLISCSCGDPADEVGASVRPEAR